MSAVLISDQSRALDDVIGAASFVAANSATPRALADRFADAVNIKDHLAGTADFSASFARAQTACASSGRRAIYVPEIVLDAATEATISLSGLAVRFDPGARIRCTNVVNGIMSVQGCSDVLIDGISGVGVGARSNQVGSYLGAPLRERNAVVYVVDAERVTVRNGRSEAMNVGVRNRGLSADNVTQVAGNQVDGWDAIETDFGVLFDLQDDYIIRRLRARHTTFTTTSPPHAIYGSGQIGRTCGRVTIRDCDDVDNQYDCSFKLNFIAALVVDGVRSKSSLQCLEIGDCDEIDVRNWRADDVYNSAVYGGGTGGVTSYGCERGRIANGLVVLRYGESIPIAVSIRPSNSRSLGAGGDGFDMLVENVRYFRDIGTAAAPYESAFVTTATGRTRFIDCHVVDKTPVTRAAFNLATGSGHVVKDCTAKGTSKLVDIQPGSGGGHYVIVDPKLTDTAVVRDFATPASTISTPVAASAAYPIGYTMCVLGDSREDRAVTTTVENPAVNAHEMAGSSTWIRFLSRGAIDHEITDNYALSGAKTADLGGQIDAALASGRRYDLAYIRIGTNDAHGDVATSTSVGHLKTAVDRLARAGMRVCLAVETPRPAGGWEGDAQTQIDRSRLALALATYARELSARLPNVILADATKLYLDPSATDGSAIATLFADAYVHENPTGALTLGAKAWAALSPIVPPRDILVSSPADVFDDIKNPYGNKLTNSLFTGSVAISSGVATGVKPTGWTSTNTSGFTITGGTAVWSKVPQASRTDGGWGDQAVLTITGLQGSSGLFRLYLYQTLTAASGMYAVGETLFAAAELSVAAGSAGLLHASMRIDDYDGAFTSQHIDLNGGTANPAPATAYAGVLQPPRFQAMAASQTISVVCQVLLDLTRAGGASAVVRFATPSLRRAPAI
ncbi:SGNH/GDSL hydrolase family protein [Methylosinus sp. Sm6]|uniref:SGNH/GDSL hydrolase family protein n=1 Tax=Methylosinus sp. Sm6 TaxID=2866948 RepID=UPI001C9A09EC|nr:SGNH/GDSL hydrolase family protein [Methylosinus sp. Sm6]MBY6243735.1 SGNH/GDSL hydrolase family protein [Methylosinus sp. Sm6]